MPVKGSERFFWNEPHPPPTRGADLRRDRGNILFSLHTIHTFWHRVRLPESELHLTFALNFSLSRRQKLGPLLLENVKENVKKVSSPTHGEILCRFVH